MLEWLGLIPILGLQGNWRGYKMGGKAVGGVMDADMKGKFEAARAAGDMDKAKAMADKAQAEKPEKENGKGAGEKSVSKLIDKNESAFVGMSKKEIDELKGINEKTSVDDIQRIVNNFGQVDVNTFDNLQRSSAKLTGENATSHWNEFFRQLQKVADKDDPKDVDTLVQKISQNARGAGKDIRGVSDAVAKDASKAVGAPREFKENPRAYINRQGEFYEKAFPIIAQRIGDVRKKQLAAEEAAMAKQSNARSKAPTSTSNDDMNLDDLFN